MLTLGIETSGRNASVALLKHQTVLEQALMREAGRPDTKRLPVCVQEMLQQQGVKPNELDCLAVSRGPGSFTGLRVGLVFAKTFGYATGVPLVAVDTFAAIVEPLVPTETLPQTETIEVVEDLRKGQIAWQRFVYHNEEWQPEAAIEVSLIEQWATLPREMVSLTGPGIDRILKQLPENHTLNLETILPEQNRSPEAVAIAILGQKELLRTGPVDPFEVNPLYIRRSAAEEKRTSQ